MTIGAAGSRRMEVNTATLPALEVACSRTREAEIRNHEDVLGEYACSAKVSRHVGGESGRHEAVHLSDSSQVLSHITGRVRLAGSAVGRKPAPSAEHPNHAVGGLLNKGT